MAVDRGKNFTTVTLATGVTNTDTTFVLSSGHGALLEDPSSFGAYNLVLYDKTLGNSPMMDDDREIVRVTALTGDSITVTRAQEDTVAVNHNTVGHNYVLDWNITAILLDQIRSSYLQLSDLTDANIPNDLTINTTSQITAPSIVLNGYYTDNSDIRSIYSNATWSDTSYSHHPVRIQTFHTLGTAKSLAVYDAQATTAGANNSGHIVNFQGRSTHDSDGTLQQMYGLYNTNTNNGGLVTSSYGAYLANATGTGSFTNQYGVYVESLDKATTNYAFYSAGLTPSYMGGNLTVGTGNTSYSISKVVNSTSTLASILQLRNDVNRGLENWMFSSNHATSYAGITGGDLGMIYYTGQKALLLNVSGAYPLILATNGTEALRVNSSQEIIVGITDNGPYSLQNNGDFYNSGSGTFGGALTGTSATMSNDIEVTNSTKGLIFNSVTKRWRITINDNGNLEVEEL